MWLLENFKYIIGSHYVAIWQHYFRISYRIFIPIHNSSNYLSPLYTLIMMISAIGSQHLSRTFLRQGFCFCCSLNLGCSFTQTFSCQAPFSTFWCLLRCPLQGGLPWPQVNHIILFYFLYSTCLYCLPSQQDCELHEKGYGFHLSISCPQNSAQLIAGQLIYLYVNISWMATCVSLKSDWDCLNCVPLGILHPYHPNMSTCGGPATVLGLGDRYGDRCPALYSLEA